MAIKLLFIDDSSMVLKTIKIFLKDLLESGSIEFEGYNNPTETYEKLRNFEIDFDILFVDIYMPNIDGYELTRRLREIPQYQCKPIIALTTEISQESKMQGKEAGVNGWITKMSSPAVMRDAIENAIDKFVKKG